MMILVYDTTTGQLLQTTDCPENQLAVQTMGQDDRDWIPIAEDFPLDGRTQMVNVKKKTIAVRPTLKFDKTAIIADGTDKARLVVGVPFEAAVDGVVYPVNDGILEITSSMAARYRVRVDHFPYQTLDVEITAT